MARITSEASRGLVSTSDTAKPAVPESMSPTVIASTRGDAPALLLRIVASASSPPRDASMRSTVNPS